MIQMYVENTDNKIKYLFDKHYVVPNYVTNNFKKFKEHLKEIPERIDNLVLYMVLFGYCSVSVAEFKYFVDKDLNEYLTKRGIKYKLIVSTTTPEYMFNKKKTSKVEQNLLFNIFKYDPLIEIEKNCFNIIREGENLDMGLKADIVGVQQQYLELFNEAIFAKNLHFIKTDFIYDDEEDCFKISFTKDSNKVLRNDVDYPEQFFVEGALDFLLEEGETNIDNKAQSGESSVNNNENELKDVEIKTDDNDNVEKLEEQKVKSVINTIDKFDPSSISEDLEDLGELIQKIHTKDNKITKKQRLEFKKNEAIREQAEKDREKSKARNLEKDKQIKAFKDMGYSDTVLEILSKVESDEQ